MLSALLAQVSGSGINQPVTADKVLEQYIFVFYGAFAVAFLFTPVMRLVASYYGIIDEPDRVRKMHTVPVAYLGGIAVFLGWLCGLAISQFRTVPVNEPGVSRHVIIYFSIIVGAIVIIILGLWDDAFRIAPKVKITGQLIAALLLISDNIGTRSTALLFDSINRWLGAKSQTPGSFFAQYPFQIPEWVVWSTSSIVVVIIVLLCCNASNLMDGLDGLCSGVTAIIALGFTFIAVHLSTQGGGLDPNLDMMRVVLAISLLGAVLGFIPFNFNPASIFMGDTGSMFLGYCCAVMILLTSQGQEYKWLLASLVMFALPILDTVLAFTRRWIAGRPLFSADKLHFHHQLVARGLSVRQTVLVSYGLALFFSLCGAAIAVIRTRYAIAFYMLLFAYLVVTAYKMGMVHERPRVVTRKDLTGAAESQTAATPIEPGGVIEITQQPGPNQSQDQIQG